MHWIRSGPELLSLLALSLFIWSAQAVAQNQSTQGQQFDISLAELLDENGNIELPSDFSGSIDSSGFVMTRGQDGEPRFVPAERSAIHPWSENEFPVPGCDGTVRAITAINEDLFIGGSFESCGFVSALNLVRFNLTTRTLTALGDGVTNDRDDATVSALAAIGTDLYVGGTFDLAGDLPVNNIAKFDTTQTGNAAWSSLGDGLDDDVNVLAIIGTNLYVGGWFEVAGGAPANFIAKFDTTESGNQGWSTLGNGVNNDVRALAVIGTDLYVGGSFSQAGGVTAKLVAKFDTAQSGNLGWSALGDGIDDSTARVVALAVVGTDLYVGGGFEQADGAFANHIAKFDTTQTSQAGWSTLGDGVDDTVIALTVIGTDLYVGGRFSQAGTEDAWNIARFDTSLSGNSGWSSLGRGVESTVATLTVFGSDLYVGGSFFYVGSFFASRHVAVYDTTQTGNAGWSGFGHGVDYEILAMAAIGTDLYVGGSFNQVGAIRASRIAKFDTTQTGNAGWSTLGDGIDGFVFALAVIGTDLYVGGVFGRAGDVEVNHIARFDTTLSDNSGWSALGDGLDDTVRALAVIGTDLFAGGRFSQAGDASASRIAKFDTAQTGNAGWSALGDGVDNSVDALAVIGTDLYVAGWFELAGDAPANYIAKFDTTQTSNAGWSALGDGVDNPVAALAAIGTDLYVGGRFIQAGNLTANRIAKYDTTQIGNTGWSALGDGINGQVGTIIASALAVIGTDLYVSGGFSEAGNVFVSSLARFDTTQTGNAGWSSFGSVNIFMRVFLPIGTDLYLGGGFQIAGGNENGSFARYKTDPDLIYRDGFENPLP